MTPYYIEKIDDLGEWIHTAPSFLKNGDIVRLMRIRSFPSREFIGDKFLATMRWDYNKHPNVRRFMFTTMTDDGLNEMWPD